MDPQAPAQPSIDTSYKHPGNPSDQDPAERSQAESHGASSTRTDATAETREQGDVPSGEAGQSEATPSSLGLGGQGEKDKDVSHYRDLTPQLQANLLYQKKVLTKAL